LLGVGGHQLGGLVPFYIDWLDCDHPAASAPDVGRLEVFQVTLPTGHQALELLDPAPVDVTVTVAAEPGLLLRFDSPRGSASWTEAAPSGFAF
jgi:hypothetical protein